MNYVRIVTQWLLSKLFPFKDINAYSKDRAAVKAAACSVQNVMEDMRSNL